MPFSTGKFKLETKELLIKKFPRSATVLDVGPGSGIYSDILSDWFYDIDAVEVHTPYIEMFHLNRKYRKVFEDSIQNFYREDTYYYCDDAYPHYAVSRDHFNIVIMGDVLEHLSVEDAQMILKQMAKHGSFVVAAVPYDYEQGTEMGNVHETHLQSDLNESVMDERYPELILYVGDDTMGVYVPKSNAKISGGQRTNWTDRDINEHMRQKALKELQHKELRRWIAQDVQISHTLSKDQDIGEL